MEKRAMMPLIIFDAVVNLYLNVLFIIPLRSKSVPLPDTFDIS